MKKSFLRRMAVLAVVLCLATTSLMSGTLAKYTTTVTGSDEATVAKWEFQVNDTKVTTESFTFDLFEGKDKVAPGDSGNVTLTLKNASEVAATYKIEYTVTNAGSVPIQFSTDNTTWTALSDVPATDIESNGTATITIYWKWNTTSDQADTAFGTKDKLDTVKVEAKITAEQKLTSAT